MGIYDSIQATIAALAKIVFLSVIIFPLEGMFLWPSFSQIPGFLGLALLVLLYVGETVTLFRYSLSPF